jgi:hypothetical protein
MASQDQPTQLAKPALALRLLDWMVVGTLVFGLCLASMYATGTLLLGQPPFDLSRSLQWISAGGRILLTAIVLGISVLAGMFIDRKSQPLTLLHPLRFGQHVLFGLAAGALVGMGVYGFFRASYQSDQHDLAWYIRDYYSIAASGLAYWLVYELPKRWKPLV